MAKFDTLGTRMKEYYENIPKTKLMRRTPVAIRIDGKAFHTFTRDFEKPFDRVLMKTMQETTKYLCENIMGCVCGYTQSDEITLILVDYKKLDSDAWFDYEVQKLCSVSASMATMAFNKIFEQNVDEENYEFTAEVDQLGNSNPNYKNKDIRALWYAHKKALSSGAMFDARCFNIPREEVTNLIYWRQQDASRNSIQMVGQAYFSHSELHKKNQSQIQDMLMDKYRINWNNYRIPEKRGTSVIRDESGAWVIDEEMPILKGDDRIYIEKLLLPEED